MEKMIKKTKLFLYICLATFLLNSCTEEKEYLENGNRDIKTSKKSFKELMLLNDFSKAYKKVAFEKQRNLASRTALEEQYNFTIAEDKEVNVVEIDGKTFYNLLIRRDVSTTAFFENLLIKTEIANNQEEASAYIVKYFTPDDSKYTYGNDKEITQLYGKITIVKRIVCVTLCHATNSAHPLPHSPYCDACYSHLQTQCWEYYEQSGEEDNGGGGNSNTGTTTSGGGGGGDGSSSGAGGSPPPQNGASAPPDEELELLPVEEEVEEEEKTPCEELKDLLKPNDTIIANPITIADTIKRPKLKTRIQLIGSKVIYPKEYGCNVFYKRRGDVFTNGPIVGGGVNDAFTAPLEVGGDIYGGIHNHPVGGHEIPSFGDIDWILDCYDSTYVYNKNRVFSIIAVRKLGTTTVPPEVTYYAFKVEDVNLLRQNVEQRINSIIPATLSRDDKIDLIHKQDGAIFDKFPNDLEKKFLEKYGNYGVGLYKVNASMTNWSKLTLNAAGLVVPIPCSN